MLCDPRKRQSSKIIEGKGWWASGSGVSAGPAGSGLRSSVWVLSHQLDVHIHHLLHQLLQVKGQWMRGKQIHTTR